MKYILIFIKDTKLFDKGFSIQCEKIPEKLDYDNGKSYEGVYRFKNIVGKTEFIDIPFEYEGIIYEIREEPQTD